MLQMANNLLSNDERLLLIEKYEADKLNKPPKNIKDETLITNYGTDEQKARLQAAPAAKAPKATENKTASPAAGAATEPAASTGNEDTEVEQGTQANTGDAQAEPAGTQAAPAAGNAPAPAAPDKNQEYVQAFNEYVDLYFKMPADNLTTEQLIALNEQKRAANEQAAQAAATAKEEQAKKPFVKPTDSVTIVNNKTKEVTTVPRFTWERFISKDGTHTLKAETPAEIKDL